MSDTATEVIIIILTLVTVSGCGYGFYALFCVLQFLRSCEGIRCVDNGENIPMPVSVLKPVKGLDPGFRENIESFCRQDYPVFEVLLGFTEEDDPALKVAMEIADSAPDGKVRVIISHENLGENRKVSNLQGLLGEARYSLLAISDSDMRVQEGYLRTVIQEYRADDKVGMVTSLYAIPHPDSAGAALESLSIALDFIPSVLVAGKLEGITFGLGASMLLSKEAISDIGGLGAIADYLADDYQIGHRLWKKGHKIALSRYVVEDVAGAMTYRGYFAHQLRWARTNRASRPWGYLGYGITHILPLSLFLVALTGATPFSLAVFGLALALRLIMTAVIYRHVICSRRWLLWLYLLPVKDLSAFVIWVWSFAGRRVFWRGASYFVGKGGIIRPPAAAHSKE